MKRFLLSALLLAAFLLPAHAQRPGPGPHGHSDHDPIAEHLFAPELVMRHSSEIALDERQRASIREAVQKSQSRFTDLRFDLQPEAERMARLLQSRPIDEAAVLAQADRIMGLEREIKKTHLALLIRIRNQLTTAQLDKLAALRRPPQR